MEGAQGVVQEWEATGRTQKTHDCQNNFNSNSDAFKRSGWTFSKVRIRG